MVHEVLSWNRDGTGIKQLYVADTVFGWTLGGAYHVWLYDVWFTLSTALYI